MIGKPKYKIGDKVSFKLEDTIYTGYIHIVDAYGTFENSSDVSYDIIVENYGNNKTKCLFKHINEYLIIKQYKI